MTVKTNAALCPQNTSATAEEFEATTQAALSWDGGAVGALRIRDKSHETLFSKAASTILGFAHSMHTCKHRQCFLTYRPKTASYGVNGQRILGHRNVRLRFSYPRRMKYIILRDVGHTPDATTNIVSVARLGEQGIIYNDRLHTLDQNGKHLCATRMFGGHHLIDYRVLEGERAAVNASSDVHASQP